MQPWLRLSRHVWPWEESLPCLGLSFLICNIRGLRHLALVLRSSGPTYMTNYKRSSNCNAHKLLQEHRGWSSGSLPRGCDVWRVCGWDRGWVVQQQVHVMVVHSESCSQAFSQSLDSDRAWEASGIPHRQMMNYWGYVSSVYKLGQS